MRGAESGFGAGGVARALEALRIDLEGAIRRLASCRDAEAEGPRRDILSIGLADLIAMRGHLADLTECLAASRLPGEPVAELSRWQATFEAVRRATREIEAAAPRQRPVAA